MKILLAIFILPFFSPLVHIKAQQKRILRGEVVFVKENSVQEKQKKIEIYIKETGDRDLTDNSGIFRIFLGDSLNAGERVSLGINKKGWEIQYPIYGETYIPANTDKELLKVKILPISSPLFLSHDQITRFLEYSIQKGIKESNINFIERGSKLQIDSTLKSWAEHTGLSDKQVKDAFYKWLEDTYKGKENYYERGLAEYVKENYITAAEMLNKSAMIKQRFLNNLVEESKKLYTKQKDLVNEIIRDSKLAGESFEKNKDYTSAIETYKRVVYYLQDHHDIDLLLSSLNELAQNYFYLSILKADYSKLNLLDSAETLLTQALSLTDTLLSEHWRLIIEGNLALIRLERNGWTLFGEKRQYVIEALKNLRKIEEKKKNTNTKDWIMGRHNISICYILLYQYTKELDSASLYLDSSLASFNSINDSTTLKDFPLSRAYINYNMSNALLYKLSFLIKKSKADHWLSRYLHLFDKNNTFYNCTEVNNEDEIINDIDELINQSISCAQRAITFLRENNREPALASALNLMADAKIKQLLYNHNYLSLENIQQIVKLINEAVSICDKENLEGERIYSQELMGKINPIFLLQSDSLHTENLIKYLDLLSKELVKTNYLSHFQVLIKRDILLNYLIVIYRTDNDELRMEYLNRAEFTVNDIINNYYGLMEYRWVDEFINYKSLMSCIRKSFE